jgi:arylsulfatase
MISRRELLGGVAASAWAQSAAAPPNVIIFYCDDLGYGDLGCYGSKLRTPNIDRLAAEGARLTHFYSANPVCSPSRAALLTGRYPTRVNMPRVLFPNDKTGLPENETTIAQALKKKGYRTQCVGKWHLGHLPDYLPARRGFDGYFGIPYSNDMAPRTLVQGTETIEQTAPLDTLSERYAAEALKFIEADSKSPFFLYFPHTYPHIPLGAGAKFKGKSPHGLYGDVIEELDWTVGEILAALKRKGLDQNTLFIFSSDNGPWFQGSPGKLRGRKGSTEEGGVRVPLLARWPGRIPRGLVSDAVGSTMDLLPTIAKLAGAELPANLDGIDLWPVLTGRQKAIEREALLYFDNWNLQCARLGEWKLHLARYNSFVYGPAGPGGRVNLPLEPPELYNVVTDPQESYDVAAKYPEVVARIRERVMALLPTFPEPVREAWTATQARPTLPSEPGRLPRGK